jgi:hypothetical protein
MMTGFFRLQQDAKMNNTGCYLKYISDTSHPDLTQMSHRQLVYELCLKSGTIHNLLCLYLLPILRPFPQVN